MRPLEKALFNDGFQFVAQHFPRVGLHDQAVLTYFYARRRLGVAVKGLGFRLRDPLPSRAEKALDPFRNFIRFVEAKQGSVKYDPNQPRVPAGHPDGGQWTDAGGGGGRGKPTDRIRLPASSQKPKLTGERNIVLASDITGFKKHGINQAITRGVSPTAILDAVNNPLKVQPRSNGTTRYIGNKAVVVLNPEGEVVTVWGQ